MKQFLIAAIALTASLSPAVANADQRAKVSADAPGCYNATDNRIPCAELEGSGLGSAGLVAEFTPAIVMPAPSGRFALAFAPPIAPPLVVDDVRDLNNTSWTIVAVDGKRISGLMGISPKLAFGIGEVSVATGCRGFRADVKSESGSALFEIQPEPKIAIQCSDDLEHQELRIGTVIATAVQISVHDKFGLTITDSNGGTLTAQPLKPSK